MSLESRHCLVVGGTGFIGRRIVERFAHEGAFVESWGRTPLLATATLGQGPDRARDAGARVTRRAVDLLGNDSLPEPPPGGWDLVVHLAGYSRPRHFDSHADVLDTVRMMVRVLRHLEHVSPGCRFILNSSGYVYSPSAAPHVETDPTHPRGQYALSKLICEEIAMLHRDRLDVTIVRAFNLLGPGMPEGLLVTDFMRTLERLPAQGLPTNRIVMAGRNSWRDFLDIRDAVDAYCALAELECESGTVFNLCSGDPTRVAELLGAILGVMGLDLQVDFQDPTEEQLLGDPTRLREATGWTPRHGLIDIVESLVEARRVWLAICSLVRDGMPYLPAYRHQIESLVLADGDAWRLYVIEGDSRDESWSFLQRWAGDDPRVRIAQMHVGKAESAEQMAQNWAKVCNACFDLIPADSEHTHVLWLESDLTFPSETARRLLARGVDVVAPIIFLGGQFYDTWGFRDVNGRRWTNEAPYHPDYAPNRLLPMGSVGSCVLFRRAVFEAGIRMRGTYEDGLLVGMCNDARAAGMRVWADTGTAILHPVDQWERQMWRTEEVTVEGPSGGKRFTPIDFERERIVPIMALLDAAALLRTQGGFLLEQFAALRTNRLDVEVSASSHPRRRFTMKVRPGVPHGIGALPLMGRLLRRRLSPQRLARASEPGARGFHPFRCQVHISMEQAHISMENGQ